MTTSTPNITIRRATEANDIAECLRIRHAVFVREQGIPADIEHDIQDRSALHFIAFVNEQSFGAARVLIQDDRCARIGRVAVLSEKRGCGIGRTLMSAIEGSPEMNGVETFVLHAQVHAVPFYQSLAYEPYGEEFISEAGKRARHMKKANPLFANVP